MPLYEYRCRSCKRTVEVLQKFDDRPLRKCEECSGRLDKLVSRTSFLLRGGGWYADGYGKSSKPSSSSSSSDSSSSDSSSSDSSSSDSAASSSSSSSADKSGSGTKNSSGSSSGKSD